MRWRPSLFEKLFIIRYKKISSVNSLFSSIDEQKIYESCMPFLRMLIMLPEGISFLYSFDFIKGVHKGRYTKLVFSFDLSAATMV